MKHRKPEISQHAAVLDTLKLARKLHPGQRNSLDALCKRYAVDASNRDLHGALIDSELLARVYLAMTGGQTALSLDEEVTAGPSAGAEADAAAQRSSDLKLVVIRASEEEVAAHNALVEKFQKSV